MTELACYRIRRTVGGVPIDHYTDVLDLECRSELTEYGPIDIETFSAMLFVRHTTNRLPRWAPFVQQGFVDVSFPLSPGISALLVVSVGRPAAFFALTFGVGGRYLLRHGSFEGDFGVRAALHAAGRGGEASFGPRHVEVRPFDTATWGPKIVGDDAVRLSLPLPFERLGDLCLALDDLAGPSPTPDDDEREELIAAAARHLQRRGPESR